jgi:hypothetical protein
MIKELPNVTVVAITTRDYGTTITAIKKTLEQIKPHSVIFFSDHIFESPDYESVQVPKMNWEQYNEFVCKELWRYITTSHVLLIQHDGFVLDGSVWTDEFLEYDYIGAPWTYKDGRNVGNGGFSLRSHKLQHILSTDEFIDIYTPEDEIICRLYRKYLEKKHGIKFAPEELAHKFSFEMHPPQQKTFGFHNKFHQPFKPFIILKRAENTGLGDIIMMEPVMEYFHKNGYRVVLDIPAEYFHVFIEHFFTLLHISQLNSTDGIDVINLEMSYESKPLQLVLKSYYEFCGVEKGVMRNPRLNFPVDKTTKMFNKYIVMHVDDTGMPHRNVHGVDWASVADAIKDLGYDVIQIGGKDSCGIKLNTPTKQSLMYAIAGADFFIGIDSGPSQIAVSLGVKSILFFGSVDARLRYPDLNNIRVIQNKCEFAGCYHSTIGVRGVDCVIEKDIPPCITHSTQGVIEKLSHYINTL